MIGSVQNLRKCVATVQLNAASTNITTSAWATVVSSLVAACSAIEVWSSTGNIIKLAQGSAGNEVEVPYTISPGGSPILVPLNLSNAARLSAKAVDQNASTGYLVINFYA